VSTRIVNPHPAFTCSKCQGPMQQVLDARGNDMKMWHCERCGHRETHAAIVQQHQEQK
jgi:hypothetical protein